MPSPQPSADDFALRSPRLPSTATARTAPKRMRLALLAGLLFGWNGCGSPGLHATAQEMLQAASMQIRCTPKGVMLPSGELYATEYPIAAALQSAGPGSVISLEAGEYRGFSIGFRKDSPWNARTSGGRVGLPVTVRAEGRVRIQSGSWGDTISITQEIPNGHFVFEGLDIEPGYRAAVMFYKQGNRGVHDGFRFLDCNILGTYDHATGQGRRSKWGIWGQSLKDFEFRGVTRRAHVRNIEQEHGFYLQNCQGYVLIENVTAAQLGRTFCQFTARESEGPTGTGTIVVRGCMVEDVGIARGDGYKGGAAFTIAGRVTGTIVFEGNHYRAGFDPRLKHLTKPGVPYGTGALVCWEGGETVPNGSLILAGNVFEFAPDSGDRALVSISGCRELQLLRGNRFLAGASPVALELDPVDARNGKLQGSPIRKIVTDGTLELRGSLKFRGEEVAVEELGDLVGEPESPLQRSPKSRRGGER